MPIAGRTYGRDAEVDGGPLQRARRRPRQGGSRSGAVVAGGVRRLRAPSGGICRGMAQRATVLDRRLRACDLDDLPHEWDTRYELVAGVLFISRRPSNQHQEAITRIVVALYPPVSAAGGKVLPEVGL